MKCIPDPVPHGHGVYALVHPKTQSLYIGSSTNLRARSHEWRSAIKHRNNRLRNQAFPDYPVDEWEFRVLKRTEGLSYPELRDLEMRALENARAKGMQVINKVPPAASYRFTVDGIEGSATFHAARLGINPSTVTEKLRRGDTIEQALGFEKRFNDERSLHIGMMGVKILDTTGEPLTYAEASKSTGRSVEALKRVCANLKRLGRTEVPIANLAV